MTQNIGTRKDEIIDEVLSIPINLRKGLFFISAFRIKCGTQTTECSSLHLGEISEDQPNGVLVRIHSGCLTGDVFGSDSCDCGWQLEHALDTILTESRGVLVYLPAHEGRGNGLFDKVRSFRLMNQGLSSAAAFRELGVPIDGRDYTPAMLILRRLGLQKLRLITNNPAKLESANRYGFEVIARVPSVVSTVNSTLLKHMQSKKRELGHLIEV
jgi:3,4-dihydroxy 2-butanone 4-phosphate synthase / GTP cyclohydrolase II